MRFFNKPKVYLVGKTSIVTEGLKDYLADIGSPDWQIDLDVSDAENLIEAAGRMCYRSWQEYDPSRPLATNPNVSKVRKGNDVYIRNVLEGHHGSILEHATMSFICCDVSRVFTHELVRHRAGMAYSQESLRYVRLDEIPFWLPEAVKGNEKALEKYKNVIKYLEEAQTELATTFNIKSIRNFHTKKEITSMFRRLLPEGMATSIFVTGNLRAWRHIIAMRTSSAAEAEIRVVLDQIARICKRECPNVFQDMQYNHETQEWTFLNEKV